MLRLYLYKKREASGLSMNKLAKSLDMDVHHYSQIENGEVSKVNFLLFCKIALALDISLYELYRYETAYQNEKEEKWFDEAF